MPICDIATLALRCTVLRPAAHAESWCDPATNRKLCEETVGGIPDRKLKNAASAMLAAKWFETATNAIGRLHQVVHTRSVIIFAALLGLPVQLRN